MSADLQGSSRPDPAPLRAAPHPQTATHHEVDLLVVGGGVNGAGIARDAAGRGLRVLLCERDDLASHTSSASTKLIHGGLRYLEHYEFALVRKALQEREVLLSNAPHIMWPLRFVLPHDPSMRPGWMMRIGLFLYDHLARRKILPGSSGVDLTRHESGAPLRPEFRKGFIYSDGWVDDARLVVLNALDVALLGGTVLTRTLCRRVAAEAGGGAWEAELCDARGQVHTVRARGMVNATGAWAARFLRDQAARSGRRTLRLIKGSHIVVPRLFDHAYAYILQNPDGRIVFAIPYEEDFTLIGTTDIEQPDSGQPAECSDEEVAYLCELISRYFRKPVRPEDVVWRYSGVRPLLDDESGNPSAITRDYSLELTGGGASGEPPCLTVWGGKITTYRKLAEEAVDAIAPLLDARSGAWTSETPLPGGDFSSVLGPNLPFDKGVDALVARTRAAHPWLSEPFARRLVRAYGTRVDQVLSGVAEAGEEVAPGVFAFELEYLWRHEWATCAEDALWRRSKLGLRLDAAGRSRVEHWFSARAAAELAPAPTADVRPVAPAPVSPVNPA